MSNDRPDPSRPEDPDHGLDVDAAFAEIVAQWGPVPDAAKEADKPTPEEAPDPLRERNDAAAADTEEHFVPPPPPPLPTVEPRRRLAWFTGSSLLAGALATRAYVTSG